VAAEAALERAPGSAVLDPPARVHLERAVVHPDTDRDGDLTPVGRQDLPRSFVQTDPVGGELEMALHGVEQTLR
jgi:hypothetical protein